MSSYNDINNRITRVKERHDGVQLRKASNGADHIC